jgi:two-component system, sporulation sensor kinase E
MDYSMLNRRESAERNHKQDTYIRRFAERFLLVEGTGVILVDSNFRIVEISEMICKGCGSDRAVLLGKSMNEWFESLSIHPHPFDRSLLEGHSFTNRIVSWKTGDQSRSFTLDGDILPGGEGSDKGAFVLFRDISHLVVLEEQIRNSDRLKTIGQIAAGTAHEIRNPLTAIKGFMQLLDKAINEREMFKEREYIAIVLSELERVNGLVSEFLWLSKPKEIKLASLMIGSVIKELLPILRNEAILHNVIVRYEFQIGFPPVVIDKEMLKQVFLNLGKNAIEAMGDGGGGTLTFLNRISPAHPGKIAVEIRDSGPGIPAEQLGRIFDPFFTTKPQGTGLGLSICQRIMHDLGGSIEVSSEYEGGGTTFTVWLPFAETGQLGMTACGNGGAVPPDHV